MSPDTDLPVLGKVAAYARLYPENVKLEIVPGTIIDCGKRVREEYVPTGLFQRGDFPGARLATRKEKRRWASRWPSRPATRAGEGPLAGYQT